MQFEMSVESLRGSAQSKKIGILTSGGDAPGMNAAIRAVARTALFAGAQPYAILEGYQGLIEARIKPFAWKSASGILNLGGTVIGTARSTDFKTRQGQLTAAENLVSRGIDRLVAIGGDGTLGGLSEFAASWSLLLDELATQGRITPEQRHAHPKLICAGMVGSIDNDLIGTDITIGVDSALHRIQDAIDATASTAASHQRCFVIEVMGRQCGYLALAAAISGGCDYVLIPECPPEPEWEQAMCEQLRQARQAGRKESIVILAEGAVTRDGQQISAEYVRSVVESNLDESARVTILGHVQRGGTPSAYDRWASTWLGYTTAAYVLTSNGDELSPVFGFRGERIVEIGLDEAVTATRRLPAMIKDGMYEQVLALRGAEFQDLVRIFNEMATPACTKSHPIDPKIAVMHAGALAPGMNIATKTAVRLGISRGYEVMGIGDGFIGLAAGDIRVLTWKEVDGWNQAGGAVLGTRRFVPPVEELYAISRSLESAAITGLVIIGGWNAYQAADLINQERHRYPGLQIPIVCVPATIDNNLPGTTMSIGADTALNVVVDCIDKIKMSASASKRCFIIETMGRYCGYLALMGGFAGGAEQVYLHETGITLAGLRDDIDWLIRSFDTRERTLFLGVRNEKANPNYTTDVLAHLFDEEGQSRYDTREFTIGHIQQGGAPTPADRLLATRLAEAAVTHLLAQIAQADQTVSCVGFHQNQVQITDIFEAMCTTDQLHQRPQSQWWFTLKPIFDSINREPF